ncbi:hypothetical protein [Mesobacillus maritimus]|nr:hypothetical protein [Mesobacillus maritimus]
MAAMLAFIGNIFAAIAGALAIKKKDNDDKVRCVDHRGFRTSFYS